MHVYMLGNKHVNMLGNMHVNMQGNTRVNMLGNMLFKLLGNMLANLHVKTCMLTCLGKKAKKKSAELGSLAQIGGEGS